MDNKKGVMNIKKESKKLYGSSGVFTVEFVVIIPIFLFLFCIILDLTSMYSQRHKFKLDLYYLARALSFEYNNKYNEESSNGTGNNGNEDKVNSYRRVAKDLGIDVCEKGKEKYKTLSYEWECKSKNGIIYIEAKKEYKLKFLKLSFLKYFSKKDPNQFKYIYMNEKVVMSNESFLYQDRKDWSGSILGICSLEYNKEWKGWIKNLSNQKMKRKVDN